MQKTEIYKRNQRKAKLLSALSPVVFWLCIVICVCCFFAAARNSVGNVAEICDLLDSATHTGEEIEQNYIMLTERWGETTFGIVKGASITFINIKNAVLNGFALLNAVLSFTFLICAYALGKWAMPMLAKKIEQDNQDMVNLTILENNK